MSQFSGRATTVSSKFHGNKGVMRNRKQQKREEAETRNAAYRERLRVQALDNADLDVVQ